MNKALWILIDAVILFAVSTLFVVIADVAFSGLKGKTPKDDPIVAAISRGKLAGLETAVGEVGKSAALYDEHGRSALMRAAYINLSDPRLRAEADAMRASMIPVLLDHHMPLDDQDRDGWTALMWAAWSGLSATADALIQKGAKVDCVDRQGNDALMLAARRGSPEIVRNLLKHGAITTATNRQQQSALEMARHELARRPSDANDYKDYQEVVAALEEKLRAES